MTVISKIYASNFWLVLTLLLLSGCSRELQTVEYSTKKYRGGNATLAMSKASVFGTLKINLPAGKELLPNTICKGNNIHAIIISVHPAAIPVDTFLERGKTFQFFCPDSFRTLKTLVLYGWHLERIPEELMRLDSLEELVLMFCDVDALQSELDGFNKLTRLDFINTRFGEYPRNIRLPASLTRLNIRFSNSLAINDRIRILENFMPLPRHKANIIIRKERNNLKRLTRLQRINFTRKFND